MTTETWLLNSTIGETLGTSQVPITVGFTSNGTHYDSIQMVFGSQPTTWDLYYGDTLVWVFFGWEDEAYRTIVFDQPVTDTTLLSWLTANGTKQ